jgi:hypothetical protein
MSGNKLKQGFQATVAVAKGAVRFVKDHPYGTAFSALLIARTFGGLDLAAAQDRSALAKLNEPTKQVRTLDTLQMTKIYRGVFVDADGKSFSVVNNRGQKEDFDASADRTFNFREVRAKFEYKDSEAGIDVAILVSAAGNVLIVNFNASGDRICTSSEYPMNESNPNIVIGDFAAYVSSDNQLVISNINTGQVKRVELKNKYVGETTLDANYIGDNIQFIITGKNGKEEIIFSEKDLASISSLK